MLELIGYYLIGALGFIVAFGLAVFIHELGHFLAAKAFKVPVERFVIGFDKEAMGFMPKCFWERKIGETVYGLSFVPLGGYVKMSGSVHPELEAFFEGTPETPKTPADPESCEPAKPKEQESLAKQALDDQAALYKKPFWQKFIIFSGGVFMNVLLAMFIIAFMSWYGVTEDAPLPSKVAWLAPESPFAKAGLQQGDLITSLNGTAVPTLRDFYKHYDKLLPEDIDRSKPLPLKLNLELNRSGETKAISVELDAIKDANFTVTLLHIPAFVDYVMVNQPGIKAGLREGDVILSINGEPIDDHSEATYILRKSAGKELQTTLRRATGEEVKVVMVPRENPDEKGVGIVGIVFANSEKIVTRSTLGEAIVAAPLKTWNRLVFYVTNLANLGKKLLQGNIQSVRESLGGPVAITQLAGYHANLGFERFIAFLIALNIALAVMNILPIPLLDGGHIVLAAYEGIFGRPVPAVVLVPILNGAVYLLLGFALLISISDIFKLFR